MSCGNAARWAKPSEVSQPVENHCRFTLIPRTVQRGVREIEESV